MLQNFQRQSAQAFNSAYKCTSNKSLMAEIAFESLKDRRKHAKLILFYNMLNGQMPAYLVDLVPELVQNTIPYKT